MAGVVLIGLGLGGCANDPEKARKDAIRTEAGGVFGDPGAQWVVSGSADPWGEGEVPAGSEGDSPFARGPAGVDAEGSGEAGATADRGEGAAAEGGQASRPREPRRAASARGEGDLTTPGAPSRADAWVIVVREFREADPNALRRVLHEVQTRGGLPGAYLQQRREGVAIAFGRYKDPSGRDAQEDLARVRRIEVDGARPYASARLTPPDRSGNVGGRPDLHLLTARDQYGADAVYTLQVAAYGRDDLPGMPSEADLADSRRAAEEAAARLRAEGEEAFYYHGPLRSMVTIGVFNDGDFDSATGLWSRRVRDVMQRHPNNLYNGQAVRVSVRGVQQQRFQTSMLVRIPER